MKQKETFSIGDIAVFDSPYEQYAEHNGEKCVITKLFDHDDDEHDFFDVGLMLGICFESGVEIEAWPEELYA